MSKLGGGGGGGWGKTTRNERNGTFQLNAVR